MRNRQVGLHVAHVTRAVNVAPSSTLTVIQLGAVIQTYRHAVGLGAVQIICLSVAAVVDATIHGERLAVRTGRIDGSIGTRASRELIGCSAGGRRGGRLGCRCRFRYGNSGSSRFGKAVSCINTCSRPDWLGDMSNLQRSLSSVEI